MEGPGSDVVSRSPYNNAVPPEMLNWWSSANEDMEKLTIRKKIPIHRKYDMASSFMLIKIYRNKDGRKIMLITYSILKMICQVIIAFLIIQKVLNKYMSNMLNEKEIVE